MKRIFLVILLIVTLCVTGCNKKNIIPDDTLAEKLEAKRAKDSAAVLAKDAEIAAEYNK